MPPLDRPKKLQRISQACDLCHRRSIRCRPSAENPNSQCQNCYDFAVDCTYNRPSRRRRNTSVHHNSPPNIVPPKHAFKVSPSSTDGPDKPWPVINGHANGSSTTRDYTGAYTNIRDSTEVDVLGVAWRSFALASLPAIEQLLGVYMDVVYPIFPLFHGPTLCKRIKARDHLVDRPFFSSVMAACALASARARDGALTILHSQLRHSEPESEVYFTAASDGIGKDFKNAQGLDYMRACALLALTSIQYGQISTMHQYLGHYQTLSAMQQFHDETCWPQNLSDVESEERRRLYWSMYSLEVYTSVVFNGVLRTQETHSNVRYPRETDDENIGQSSVSPTGSEVGVSWLRGWNFTTDLYRVLEHTIKRLRAKHSHWDDRVSVVHMLVQDSIPDAAVMDRVLNMYYQLPAQFKETLPATGQQSKDVFGFQSANIQATLQLVRMTLFSMNMNQDVEQKCKVAEQVLSQFHQIPSHYLKAISTPLVYHLGGIGHILASVMEGQLCEISYQRVRTLLLSMADLLQGLENGLQPTAGASHGLRAQVDRIDKYMEAQRRSIPSVPQEPVTLPAPERVMGYQPGLAPLDEFQLPPELLGEWPWPFDFTQENHYFPNGFRGDIAGLPALM